MNKKENVVYEENNTKRSELNSSDLKEMIGSAVN